MSKKIEFLFDPSILIAILIVLPLIVWSALTPIDTIFGRGGNICFLVLIALFISKFIKDGAGRWYDYGSYSKYQSTVLVTYYVPFIVLMLVFNLFLTYKINIGIPFGHAGDFFHILDLAYSNNYSEISQIGYLPGLLSITKILSMAFMIKEGLIDRNFYAWMLYFIIFFISLYITFLPLIKANSIKGALPFFLIFLTSYPYLLELERGNFVILSMVFLALSIQFYGRVWSGIFLGFFATLKVLNIVFLPSFLLSRKVKLTIFGFAGISFGLIVPLILFYLTDSDIDYRGLFGRIISTGSFQDAHVAVAHSGVYAALTFFQNSGLFPHIDRLNFLNKSIYLLLIFLVLYYLIEIFIYTIKRKSYQKKDLCISLISVFILTKLFHQNNTDMNLILLFPMMIQLMLEKLSYIEKLIISLLFLLLFPFYSFVLFNIEEFNSFFYYSFRTLIYTLIYILVITLSFFRLYQIARIKE